MPDFNNIVNFEDYLEQLCSMHTDVAHNVGGKKAFARLLSDEQVNQLLQKAGANIVTTAVINGRAIGSIDEAAMRQYNVIQFASYAKTQNPLAIKAAVAKSFAIMMQFLAQIRIDAKADSCEAMAGIRLQDVSWDLIPDQPILDNHYGWELSIPFDTVQPDKDAAKWLALTFNENNVPVVDEDGELVLQEAE